MGTIVASTRFFTADDAEFWKNNSDDLFARKFDETVDQNIFNYS